MGVCKTTEKTETWEVCESATILIDLDANVEVLIKKDGETLPLEKYIEKIIEKYIQRKSDLSAISKMIVERCINEGRDH